MTTNNTEAKLSNVDQGDQGKGKVKGKVEYGKFSGRFAIYLDGLYKDTQVYFSATPAQAHRLCLAFAADWGRCEHAFTTTSDFKLGSLSKDGQLTLTENQLAKAKGIISTPALQIAKIRQEVSKLHKLGVIYATCQIPLMETLDSWLSVSE